MGIHSIIVIKNKRGEYLQYFDKKWNSFLFLNCKLPNGDDSNAIKSKIADDFNIKKDLVKVSLVGYKQHKKFSESAKVEKEYIHYFYNVILDTKLDDNMFELNGINYKWFSYSELMKDERIQEVNSDIVQFVRNFNM